MSEYRELSNLLGRIEVSNSLVQGLFRHCPLGLQIYRADGQSLFVNDVFREMFGSVPPPEYNVLHDEIAEKTGASALIRKAFNGEAVTLPLTWYDPRELKKVTIKEGRRLAMEAKAFPVFDDQGRVIHVVFIFRDVTSEQLQLLERQRVMKQLNDANTLIRDLLNGTHAVIYFKAPDSSFLLVNRQFERIFNLKSEQIVGKTGHDLFTQEVADEWRKNDLAVLETRSHLEAEEQVLHADGTLRTYISLKFPLIDSEGMLIGLCGISTDITQSRRMEQELSAAKRMEALGVLAGGIAHDFNNILGVILMHADTLPGAESIRSAALKASELTRKLLAFGRRQPLEPVPMDLNLIISELLEMLAKMMGANIALTLHLSSDPAPIHADPAQIEQILMNLCLNARDAMPKGGRLSVSTSRVLLTSSQGVRRLGAKPGEYIELKFTDTGKGMKPEVMERIFEPFYSTKEKDKGTGLGLTSVYGIVQQSGGDLAVESNPEKGTTFYLYFPQSQGASLAKRAPTEPKNEMPIMGEGTVLIIDDEDALREITAFQLRSRGFTVFEAANARLAEMLIVDQGVSPDLILSDVIMPELSGPDFIAKLSAAGLLKNTKVLFVSGYSGNQLSQHSISQESMSFLEKPYSFSALLDKIRLSLAHIKK